MICCCSAVFVRQRYEKIVAFKPPARFQIPITSGQNILILAEEVKVLLESSLEK